MSSHRSTKYFSTPVVSYVGLCLFNKLQKAYWEERNTVGLCVLCYRQMTKIMNAPPPFLLLSKFASKKKLVLRVVFFFAKHWNVPSLLPWNMVTISCSPLSIGSWLSAHRLMTEHFFDFVSRSFSSFQGLFSHNALPTKRYPLHTAGNTIITTCSGPETHVLFLQSSLKKWSDFSDCEWGLSSSRL